ncbi:hypothetical protein ACA910_001242 [Epithemia clementina (nom. ined.)]
MPVRKTSGGTTAASSLRISDIVLPNGWMVGKQLGQGAQGSVHTVVTLSNPNQETPWAVKITAKPPNKRSKTQIEARVNATSLYNEGQLYKAHLKALRGTIVPNTPEDAQGVHESAGFLFLLMERMECDLVRKIEETAARCDRPAILVGPLAVKMVELIEAIHKVRQLVIDVKPENFMFAANHKNGQQKSPRGQSDGTIPAEQLRLVDFGLMRAFQRPEKIGELQGTALYASLNMHALNNTSRRDDLEMVFYVIGEILIRLQSIADGSKHTYERTAIPSYLPWSQETSDEHLFQSKQEHVKDPTSEFFRRMPRDAARTLFQCLETVWSYAFKTDPDYNGLKGMLSVLSVPMDNRKPAAAKTRPLRTPQRSAAPAAVEAQEQNHEFAAMASPNDRALRSGRKTRTSATPTNPASATSRTIRTQTNAEDKVAGNTFPPGSKRRKATSQPQQNTNQTKRDKKTDKESSKMMEVDEVFLDLTQRAAPREIVEIDDDDDQENKIANIPKNNAELGVKLVVQTPSQMDVEYTMDHDELVFLGSKPSAKNLETGTWIEIPGNGGCRLAPNIKRNRVLHVVVKDLNQGGKVCVGREGLARKMELTKGGESVCMIPGQIYVGSSVVRLHRL